MRPWLVIVLVLTGCYAAPAIPVEPPPDDEPVSLPCIRDLQEGMLPEEVVALCGEPYSKVYLDAEPDGLAWRYGAGKRFIGFLFWEGKLFGWRRGYEVLQSR